MKPISIVVAILLAGAVSERVMAQSTTCTGRVELSDLEIGCGNEASRTVSLAKCDFRAGKQPDVQLFNVIDGQYGNVSLTIEQTQAGSFNITIRPQPSNDDPNVCKVWRFDWEAK